MKADLIMLGVVVFLLAFGGIQTYRLHEADKQITAMKAVAKVKDQEYRAKEAHDNLVREEENEELHQKLDESRKRFASLYNRYHGVLNASSNRTAEAIGSSAGIMQTGRACFDSERFDGIYRPALLALFEGEGRALADLFEGVSQSVPGVEASVIRDHVWRRWAQGVGSCGPAAVPSSPPAGTGVVGAAAALSP